MNTEQKRHIQTLKHIFPHARWKGEKLLHELNMLERQAHQHAIGLCNRDISQEEYEQIEASILDALKDMLFGDHSSDVPIFINGDPRGYALKINDGYVRSHQLPIHRDMGGYGIIAPEL